jgi:DNA-binding winged helix-turn-helix (wHTH) protein
MSMPMMTSSALSARSRELNQVKPQSRYLCFGQFQVDLRREELFKDGSRIHVPSKVYQVLLALLEKPGEIVTREDLRSRLWPSGTFVNYDANVNTSVNKLRLALGDSPDKPAFVETIPRQGYCFVGTVERRDELVKNVEAKGDVAVAGTTQAEKVSAASGMNALRARVAGLFASGWAAAILLSGVLIGIAIVLFVHRPV